MNDDPIIEALKQWGSSSETIRCMLLTGSRAIPGKSDKLSDYDVAIFTTDPSLFTTTETWLTQIGNPWVCVHEKLALASEVIPTRLVIFDPGVKVDFALYPQQMTKVLTGESIPDQFASGCIVLLDKDKIVTSPLRSSLECYQQTALTRDEFNRIVEEFWFEIYHVAKYLARGDLWSVKFRDAGIKHEFLLQMIRWHIQAKNNWTYTTHSEGKGMQEWVDPATWQEVSHCFAGFDEEDSSKALANTVKLFRRLAKETAERLGYPYAQHLDDNISSFVRSYHKEIALDE